MSPQLYRSRGSLAGFALLALVFAGLNTSASVAPEAAAKPPQELTAAAAIFEKWSPGRLDIHQISTGRGNATFAILPDGTTLLIDAGDAGEGVPEAPPVPDGSRRPGQWIARYIHHFLGEGAEARIDLAVVTHFHADHLGFAGKNSPLSKNGAYRLAGLTDVAEEIPLRRLIDRGWPDYSYPKPQQGEGWANYRAFLAYGLDHGMKVEKARPGAADQLVLSREPAQFPDFEIRVLAANGELWTGESDHTLQRFPALEELVPDDWPNENMCSIALRLRYGAFTYFTGGDLPGLPDDGYPAWQNLEEPIASAIGKTDVVLVNHHGSISPASPIFLERTQPRVAILPTWSPTHPAPVVVKRLLNQRIYPGERDLFTTRLLACTRMVIGPRAEKLTSGHIVVRVEPGGATYRVFVLDDGSDAYTVRSVHGPYSAE